MIGKQLGHYRIVRELGEGGMSQVFEAQDLQLDRMVALKVLPADLAGDPERLSRFDREARILAGLRHPNIVTIFSVEKDQGLHFLTMELVAGETLTDLIAKGSLTPRQCRDIAIAVTDALAVAHAQGIVHRDLKPSNIIIEPNGWVKVLDFGLAMVAPWAQGMENAPTLAQTRDGLILGTVPYMSPEQVEGTRVDARSDLFSLGITFYEMTTGAHPFPGDSAAHVMSAILRDQKTTVDDLRLDLSTAWEPIITRCMEREPAKRYQSAAELRQDLEDLPVGGRRRGRGARIMRRAARASRRRLGWIGALVAVLTLVVMVLLLRSPGDSVSRQPTTTDKTMVVVLPFENLGPDDNAYFVAGLTEEISSRLGRVDRIGLIARQSALKYAGTTKSAREIGEELGVEYLLGGTVRWSPQEDATSRVRITPQLIRTADDTGVWVQTFDRVVDDIFEVQSEIANEVFAQLGVTLGGAERQSLAARSTDNLDAYQAFLRGRFQKQIPDYSAEHRAAIIDLFQTSVEIDPEFVAGYQELSLAHSFYYHLGHDISVERRDLAKSAALEAFSRAPEAPEVHLALGFYYYWVEGDYLTSLQEFEAAEAGLPSNAEVLEAKALVFRRQGRWVEALDHFRLALRLNPRDPSLIGELAETQVNTRDFRTGIENYDRAIELAREESWLYVGKAWAFWMWRGGLDEARTTLDRMPATDDSQAVWMLFWQDVFDGRYLAAIDRLEAYPDVLIAFTESLSPKSLLVAHAYDYLGETLKADEAYEEARVILEAEVANWPDDPRRRSALGIAFAGLGRAEEAVREGRKAVELHPMARDAFSGAYYLSELAYIYTLVGEHDQALDLLDELLSVPSLISVPMLEIDPRWQPLRQGSRFGALLEEYRSDSAT